MRRIAAAAVSLLVFWSFTVPADAAGTVSLVSHVLASAVATPTQESGTNIGSIDAKGAKTAFVSLAPAGELVAGVTDGNGVEDAFLYDATTQEVTLISRSAGAADETANDASFVAGVSPSGRFVLIQSQATDLIDGFANLDADPDFYVYDTKTKRMTLISHVPGNRKADSNGFAQSGVITDKKAKKGKKKRRELYPVVVYESEATNLVDGFVDQNGPILREIYRYDGTSKKTTLVSRDASNPKAGSACGAMNCPTHSDHQVTRGGRYVVYNSHAQNLVAGFDDNNGTNADGADVYVYDTKKSRNTLVSRASASPVAGGNGGSDTGRPTADGRYIVYRSVATDLLSAPYDNNGANRDIFLYDQKAEQTELISHAAGTPGQTGTGTAFNPSISTDGRYVTLQVTKVNEFGAFTDANGTNFSTGLDIVQLDRTTDTFALVSGSAVAAGSGANAQVLGARATSDGANVVFQSNASDLVAGFTDNNAANVDIYLWNRSTNSIDLVSRAVTDPAAGADDFIYIGDLAANAPRVVFGSAATNHIAGFDDNDGTGADVFLFTGS